MTGSALECCIPYKLPAPAYIVIPYQVKLQKFTSELRQVPQRRNKSIIKRIKFCLIYLTIITIKIQTYNKMSRDQYHLKIIFSLKQNSLQMMNSSVVIIIRTHIRYNSQYSNCIFWRTYNLNFLQGTPWNTQWVDQYPEQAYTFQEKGQ